MMSWSSASVSFVFALRLLSHVVSADWEVSYLDTAVTDTDLVGFAGAFTDGTYGYLVPSSKCKVARFKLSTFSTFDVLDLGQTSTMLKGFIGGVADNTYGYLVPYAHRNLVRFNLADFSTVVVLDLALTHTLLTAFSDGFIQDGFMYLVPFYAGGQNCGKAARVSTMDFATVATLDLDRIDMALTRFRGGFSDGVYSYFTPSLLGKVARVLLNDFSTVTILDLIAFDATLKGFGTSFLAGDYGYMTPFKNSAGVPVGKLARFSIRTWGTVQVLDLVQTDAGLKGFVGGFQYGARGCLVPNDNGAFSGKFACLSLQDFSTGDVLDLTGFHPYLKGFKRGFSDGTYGYFSPNNYSNLSGLIGRIKYFQTTTTTRTSTSTRTSSTSTKTTTTSTTSLTTTTTSTTKTTTTSTTTSTKTASTSATTTRTTSTSTSTLSSTTTTTTQDPRLGVLSLFNREPIRFFDLDTINNPASALLPTELRWADPFDKFKLADWLPPENNAIIVSMGALNFNGTDGDHVILKLRGHRATYISATSVGLFSVRLSGSSMSGYGAEVTSLRLDTPYGVLLTAQVRSFSANGVAAITETALLSVNIDGKVTEASEVIAWTSGLVRMLHVRVEAQRVQVLFGSSNITVPISVDEGVPIMPVIGIGPSKYMKVTEFTMIANEQWAVACCGQREVHGVRMLRYGQGAKIVQEYEAPVAECVSIDYDDPRLPVTRSLVYGTPARITTAQAKRVAVMYTCNHTGNLSTRRLNVEVIDALILADARRMPRIRLNTEFQDPGAMCYDENLEPVVDPLRLYSDQASVLDVGRLGLYDITWKCCLTVDCHRNVTRVRRVEVVETLHMFGARALHFEGLPKDFVDPGAICAINTTTSAPATALYKLLGQDGYVAVPSIAEMDTGQGFHRFIIQYTCASDPNAYMEREVLVMSRNSTRSCYLYGLGHKAPRWLEVGEPYTDPGACCHSDFLSLGDTWTVSRGDDFASAGARAMAYSCPFASERTVCPQRTVVVNTVPQVYLPGAATISDVFGGNHSAASVVCIDREDGVVQPKVLDGIARRLPVVRGMHEPLDPSLAIDGMPPGHVENVFDGRPGSCALEEPDAYSVRWTNCFRDLQVDMVSRIMLDLGMLRIVHMVVVDGYQHNVAGAGFLVAPQIGLVEVYLWAGTDRVLCKRDHVLGQRYACEQQVVARIIEVRAMQAHTIICEVTPYGEVAPDPAATLTLSVTPNTGQPQDCNATGTYNCSIFLDKGDLGSKYECLNGSSRFLLHRQPFLDQDTTATMIVPCYVGGGCASAGEVCYDIDDDRPLLFEEDCDETRNCICVLEATARGTTSRGSWKTAMMLVGKDSWVLQAAGSGGAVVAEAPGGFNIPPSSGWISTGRSGQCKVSLTAASCETCRAWPATSCKDPARDCMARDDVREELVQAAYVERVSNVDIHSVGDYYESYTCVDRIGQSASVTRTVLVNCHEPDRDSTFGGNQLACEREGAILAGHKTWDSCARACAQAGSDICEGYEFWNATWAGRRTGDCVFHRRCTGRVMQNTTRDAGTNDGVFVGYCFRLSRPPELAIEVEARIAPWLDRAGMRKTVCVCKDLEDGMPTVCESDWENVVVAAPEPGWYSVRFTCVDSDGLTSALDQVVGLSGSCALPAYTVNDTWCEQGDWIRPGERCDVQCQPKFAPTFPQLVCDLPSGSVDVQPRWITVEGEPMNATFTLCTAMPCDLPQGIANVSKMWIDNVAVQAPCANLVGRHEIANGGKCIASCAVGYVASITELHCQEGLLEPATFECPERSVGLARLQGTPSYVEIELKWTAARQVPRCRTKGLRLQITEGRAGNASVWMGVVGNGCLPENLTISGDRTYDRLMQMACRATHMLASNGTRSQLREGQGYAFRMMEYCEDSAYDSTWTVSDPIVTGVAPVPKISFRLPGVDSKVQTSPELLIVMFTTRIEPNLSSNAQLKLERLESPGCAYKNFALAADEIADSAMTSYGTAGLAGDGMLTLMPSLGMWEASCSYRATIEEGLFVTPTLPRRGNAQTSWYFQWEELGPLQQELVVPAQRMENRVDGDEVVAQVRFDAKVNITCKATAINNASLLAATEWERENWLARSMLLSPAKQVGGAMFRPNYTFAPLLATDFTAVEGGALVDFKIRGLVPSARYKIECGGSKYMRWWVPTSCQASCAVNVVTPPDISTELAHVGFTRLWLCPNVNDELQESGFSDFIQAGGKWFSSDRNRGQLSAQFMQVQDWERACGETLDPTSARRFAYMRLHLTPTPTHRYSSIHFASGPFIDIKYQKQGEASIPQVITKIIAFSVCPHFREEGLANLPNASCRSYNSSVAAVYGSTIGIIKVEVTNADRSHDVLVERGIPAQLMVGQRVSVYIDQAAGKLNVSAMGIVMGQTGAGFTQRCEYDVDNGVISFSFFGQGLRLPMLITWSGADFPTGYSFNPAHPVLLIPRTPRILSLTDTTVQRISFPIQYPDDALTKRMLAAATPFAASQIFRLSLRRVNSTHAGEELCSDHSMDGWGEISCAVKRAPLRGLRLYLMQRDFSSSGVDNYEPVDAEGWLDAVQFRAPDISCLSTNAACSGLTALALGIYSTKNFADGVVSDKLYIKGNDFPNLEELSMMDTTLTEFRLSLAPREGEGPEVPLCDAVERVGLSTLTCTLARCLDVRNLSTYPKVALQLGDLVTAPQMSLLALPSPVVTSVSPTQLNDTGVEDITIHGYNFGHPLALNGNFAKACGNVMRHSGYTYSIIHKFGPVKVNIGRALCAITYHSEDMVKCRISDPVREPIETPKLGETRGAMLIKKTVGVSMSLGLAVIATNQYLLESILSMCPDGQRRVRQESTECELCPPGTFAKQGHGDSPLLCSLCPRETYQDQFGSTQCLACPENTQASALVATSREECVCSPGYFSPVWNKNRTAGMPGIRCLPCQSEELTTTAPRGLLCGRDIHIGNMCNEDLAQTCVVSPTSRNMFRVCKAFCPGGIHLPVAKPQYYFTKATAVSDTTGAGMQEFRPELVRCEPKEACASRNRCVVGYKGEVCQECVSGFYRDRLNGNVCVKCDDSAVAGTVFMVGVAVLLTLGIFMGSLFYLKTLADPIFKSQMGSLTKRTVNTILEVQARFFGKKGSSSKGFLGFGSQRQSIRLVRHDVGPYLPYWQKGDLGLILRVDDHSVCHVAAVKKGSPAGQKGVEKHWELRLVNGRRVTARTEFEVRYQIARAKLPMTLTFRGKKKHPSDGDGGDGDFDDFDPGHPVDNARKGRLVVRSSTMILSILQAFNAVTRLNLDWPPLFRIFASASAYLTLDFTFFRPECSVDARFEKAWLGLLCMPYFIICCVSVAYAVMRAQLFCQLRLDPDVRRMNEWLLRNAFLRASLSVLLISVSNHMELLLSPFTCMSREDGRTVMLYAQDIECASKDERYVLVLSVAICGWVALALVYAALLWCMYKAYHWQRGAKLRKTIPAYVALVENAAAGMKGYEPTLAQRVMFNQVGVSAFPANTTASRCSADASAAHTSTLSISELHMDFRAQRTDEDEWGNQRPKVDGQDTYDDIIFEDDFGDSSSSSSQSIEEYLEVGSDVEEVHNYFDRDRWGWDPTAWERQAGIDDDYFDDGVLGKGKSHRKMGRLDEYFSSDEEDITPSRKACSMRRATIEDANEISPRRSVRWATNKGAGDEAGSEDTPFIVTKTPLKKAKSKEAPAQSAAAQKKPAFKSSTKDLGDKQDSEGAVPASPRKSVLKAKSKASVSKPGEEEKRPRANRGAVKKAKTAATLGQTDASKDASTGRPMLVFDRAALSRDDWGALFDRIQKASPDKISRAEFSRQPLFKLNMYSKMDLNGGTSITREVWMKVYDDHEADDDIPSLATLFVGGPRAEPVGKTRSEPTADRKAKIGRAPSETSVVTRASTGPTVAVLDRVALSRDDWAALFDQIQKASPDQISRAEFRKQTILKPNLYAKMDLGGGTQITRMVWMKVYDDHEAENDLTSLAGLFVVGQSGAPKTVEVGSSRANPTADYKAPRSDKQTIAAKADPRLRKSYSAGEVVQQEEKRTGEKQLSRSATEVPDAARKVGVARKLRAKAAPTPGSTKVWAEALSLFGVDARHDGRLTCDEWKEGFTALDADATGLVTRDGFEARGLLVPELFTFIDIMREDALDLTRWVEAFELLSDGDGRVPLEKWVAADGGREDRVAIVRNRSDLPRLAAPGSDTEAKSATSLSRVRNVKKVIEAKHAAAPPVDVQPPPWVAASMSSSTMAQHSEAKSAVVPPAAQRTSSVAASISSSATAQRLSSAAASISSSPTQVKVCEATHADDPPDVSRPSSAVARISSTAVQDTPTAARGQPPQRMGLAPAGPAISSPVPSRRVRQMTVRRTSALPTSSISSQARARKRRKEQFLRSTGLAEPSFHLRYKPGATVVTTNETEKNAILAMDTFRVLGRIMWPDRLAGSFLSYGWVLLINNFFRCFCLLATICMTTSIPLLAAPGQATVFFFNFGLLIYVMPYYNYRLSLQEGLLVGALALLVWSASFRDLLQNHERAQDYPAMVAFAGQVIDVIVVFLALVLAAGVCVASKTLVRSAMRVESESQALNRAHAQRVRNMQRAQKHEIKNRDPVHSAKAVVMQEKDFHASIKTHLADLAFEINAFQRSADFVHGDDAQVLIDAFKYLRRACMSERVT